MKLFHLPLLAILGLSLFGCDKATKTTPQTTAIKAREPVIAIALVAFQ